MMRIPVLTALAVSIGAWSISGASAAPVGAAAIGDAAEAATAVELVQHNRHRRSSMTIPQQVSRDRSWQRREGWRHRRDQTNILDMQQEVTVRRAQNAERAYRAWQRYLED
jgi:hypothetical protein